MGLGYEGVVASTNRVFGSINQKFDWMSKDKLCDWKTQGPLVMTPFIGIIILVV